jgi:Na+/H+-dicarboxylate symporter
MNTIMKNMTDPGFIIPYLIIAIFIGVTVSYLRSGIDMLISYFTREIWGHHT